jgi:hypothetical protein
LNGTYYIYKLGERLNLLLNICLEWDGKTLLLKVGPDQPAGLKYHVLVWVIEIIGIANIC